MKKILVTGGTGYIGSHTVVELQQRGFEVVIVDNLSNSSIDVLDRITSITGVRPLFEKFDLTDDTGIRTFFETCKGIDAVIHFAAFKAVGESTQKPLRYYQNNLVSLINLLSEMERNGIPDLVFSSSCTVYGQPVKLPVGEDAPVAPATSPYGNTKQVSEEIIKDFSAVSNVRSILLRYFNPIGAHESALIGEFPMGEPDNLMPYITQTAIGKRAFLRVWGNDYDTPDGTAIRDYIHVTDLAKAHVVAVERMLGKEGVKPVEVFNLGTGRGYSVLEVIRSFEHTSGVSLRYEICDRRPGDIVKIWADPLQANRILGWKAEKDLDDMTHSAWMWEQALAKNK